MRRVAQRKIAPRRQVSKTYSTAAPTGGWNARDPLANMNPNDAFRLKNWFPTTTDCIVRSGSAAHATGITGIVETLAVYNQTTGTNKMFAATDTDVYDASSAGAATAQTVTITDGKCQSINFGDGTTNWLILVNGVDKPLYYDGTSWTSVDGVSTPALTGLTTTQITHVNEYKGRLFFTEKSSLSFWYLSAGAAGGALTEFDLSSFANRGGYLMWMATWSFDAGDGPDDAAVFMTSEGEAIIYRGTNPSTAADWVLAGVYQLGKPLGRRSYIKYGGDLLAVTQNGVFPLSRALKQSQIDDSVALTYKIEKAFNDAAQSYGSNFGWDATLLSEQSALIFNIPVSEGGEHKQYVMNTITKSWCEFDSWDGECFVEFNKNLYYGGSTVVNKAWAGTSDLGSDIITEAKTAFNYFGQTSQLKKMNMFRPLLRVNGDFSFLTGLDVDFDDNPINGLASYTSNSSAVWDTAKWDESIWEGSLEIVKDWSSPSANEGYAFSGGIKTNSNGLIIHWVATDFVYEYGGVI